MPESSSASSSATVSAAARKRAGSRVSAKRRIARGHRHHRLRKKVSGTAQRPRLAVHRSSRHMFVQLIDDVAGTTLSSARPPPLAIASTRAPGSNPFTSGATSMITPAVSLPGVNGTSGLN